MIPRERIDRLRAMSLAHVLQASRAIRDRHDPARWHTHRGPISITGTKFFNWRCEKGGGGAIDLVIHLFGLPFAQTLDWLDTLDSHQLTSTHRSPAKGLCLPQPHPSRLEQVKQYLITQRHLAPALLERLLLAGDLYADGHANAVFVMRNRQTTIIGAELRGTLRTWRGIAPGTKKDKGFFAIQNTLPTEIVLCEAAIDAISCFMLEPKRWCISTGGARSNPAWLKDLKRHNLPILCGFDADTVGDEKARQMIRIHPTIQRLRPAKKDWNDTLQG